MAALVKEQQEKHEFQRRRPLWGKFAVGSPLEGDGFELLVPRHKSRGFPSIPGIAGGIGGALKRYHLMVQPFFFCLEPLHRAGLEYGLNRLWLAALRGGFCVPAVQLKYTFAVHRLDQQ